MKTKTTNKRRCRHINSHGKRCVGKIVRNGLCYWHDNSEIKTGADVKKRLEEWARTGKPMTGFFLQRADLRGIDLVNNGADTGFDLSDADLYRANLKEAHLFQINLSGASLMKADLSRANLHLANLKNANLLGTVLDSTKIENIHLNGPLIQEQLARHAQNRNNPELMREYYKQSEEIYRNLRNTARDRGLSADAGLYYHKEMVMRRKQMPPSSMNRFLSRILDLICGYGEKPERVILFALFQIMVCSLIYFLLGLDYNGEPITLHPADGWSQNIHAYTHSLYFSLLNFSTSSYDGIAPTGYSLPVSALQRFVSSFTLAMFVVVFVKKITK